MYQRSVDELAISLTLNDHENAVDTPGLHHSVVDDIRLEDLQAQVPNGQDGRIVEHIASIQWQKYLANHQHLRAMILPLFVEQLQVLVVVIFGREKTDSNQKTSELRSNNRK